MRYCSKMQEPGLGRSITLDAYLIIVLILDLLSICGIRSISKYSTI